MKDLLKLEELLMFGPALFPFSKLDHGRSGHELLLTAPNLSRIGYLANSRFGAWTDNLIHPKGVAATPYVLGSLLFIRWLMFAETILPGPFRFNRVMGCGLKHENAFQNTHLGRLPVNQDLKKRISLALFPTLNVPCVPVPIESAVPDATPTLDIVSMNND